MNTLTSLVGGPARATDVRRHNLALVAREVAAREHVTRAELARATKLTKATVSTLVGELMDLRILVEVAPESDGRVGRPPTGVIALNGDFHCGVGVEINVDHIAVCVSDLLQRVRFHKTVAGDNRGVSRKRVLDRTAGLVEEAVEPMVDAGLKPAAIAVALPGTVDVETGRLIVAPNLGWSDVPIVEELDSRLSLDVPLLAENEANLAALGELWLGVGADSGDYVHVSGEIGIGGGVVVGGALFRGARGFAGEIGHIVVDPRGPRCSCGRRGCLEQVAGQEALLRSAGLSSDAVTRLSASNSALPELIAMLEREDRQALQALRAAGEALGAALADVVNVLDPDTVILGGIYAPLARWLVDPLASALAAQTIVGARTPIAVRVSALGPDAAVRGAAALVVQSLLGTPGAAIPAA